MKDIAAHLNHIDTSRVSDYRAVLCHVDHEGNFRQPFLALTKHDSLAAVLHEVQSRVGLFIMDDSETIYGLTVQDLTPALEDDFPAALDTHRLRFSRQEAVELAA